MCLSLPWFTYAVFIRISVCHGISMYFPHSDNAISVLENNPMLEFFAVSCFCLPGYILPVARSLQLLKLPDMHQGRHWPHQVLGQELSQNLTKSSTQGKCKMETSPKALRDSNIRQPSTCFGLQKMAEVLSHNLDGSGPLSSDLPSTHLPAMDVDFGPIRGLSTKRTEILGSCQHLEAIGVFQGQDVHWMKLRPAYVRTCHQLLG